MAPFAASSRLAGYENEIKVWEKSVIRALDVILIVGLRLLKNGQY
jgi:hypothetical protein